MHALSGDRCCRRSATCSSRMTLSFSPCMRNAAFRGWSRRRGGAAKCFLQEWPRTAVWCRFSLVMLPRYVQSAAPNTSCPQGKRIQARIGDLRVRQCGLWASACQCANSVAVYGCLDNREPRSWLPLRAHRGRSLQSWGRVCVHVSTATHRHCTYP